MGEHFSVSLSVFVTHIEIDEETLSDRERLTYQLGFRWFRIFFDQLVDKFMPLCSQSLQQF